MGKRRGPLRERTITFKVEAAFAEILARMPNQSEFIRKAVASMLMDSCPTCNGIGSVPPSLRRELKALYAKLRFQKCGNCGYCFPKQRPSARAITHEPFLCGDCKAGNAQVDPATGLGLH